MATNIGPKIGIEGEKEYRDAIYNIIQQSKTLSSEMKALAESIDDEKISMEQNAEKRRLLTEQIDVQKEKVEKLSEMLDKAKDKYGENADKTMRWQQAVNDAQADLNKLNKELENMPDNLDILGDKFVKIGDKIGSIGDKMGAVGDTLTKTVTVPVVGIGTTIAKVTADFDSQMSRVQAISGAAGDEIDELREKAKEMGNSTKFSATEVAEAMEYMAMAGWKTEDILAGIEGVLNLAAASGEDLARTSDIVTDAMTAYGYSAGEAGKFSDILAATATSSNTNVSLMGETFKYVAPLAGTLGFTLEDTAIATGLMASSGIKSSQAGTAMRSAFSRLADPTKDMTTLMAKLGLATMETTTEIDNGKIEKAQTKVANRTVDMEKAQIKYNTAVQKYGAESSQAQTAMLNLEKTQNNLIQAQRDLETVQQGTTKTMIGQSLILTDENGNMRSLGDVIDILRDAFSGLTESEQAEAAATLFGQEAMSGMLAVINASEEDYQNLKESITGADGAAAVMAATMNNNLNGQITELKSHLESLGISFGEIMMPYLIQFVEHLSDLVSKFQELNPETKETIIKIAGVAATIGPLLSGGSKVLNGIEGIMTTGGKLLPLIGKIGPAIGTVGTFLTSSLIPGIAAAIPAIGSFLTIAGPWIALGAAVVGIGVLIVKNWDTIKEGVTKSLGRMKDAYEEHGGGVKGIIAGAMEAIKIHHENTFNVLDKITGGKMSEIREKLSENMDRMKEAVDTRLGRIKDAYEEHGGGIKGIMAGAMEAIRIKNEDTFNVLDKITGGKMSEIREKLSENMDRMKETVDARLGRIKDAYEEHGGGIKGIMAGAMETIRIKNEDTFNALNALTNGKLEEIRGNVSNKFEEIQANVGNKLTAIKENVTGRLDELKNKFEENGGGIRGTVAVMWDVIADNYNTGFNILDKLSGGRLSDIRSFFSDTFEGLAQSALGWGSEIIENFIGGIEEKAGKVKDAISGVGSIIKEHIHFSEPDKGPLSDFNSWMPDMMSQMAEQIEAGRAKVQTAISHVAYDLTAPQGNVTELNYGGTTIQVYANDRMNVRELAEQIQEIIDDDINKKKGVFA